MKLPLGLIDREQESVLWLVKVGEISVMIIVGFPDS
jgi:hypothetical protein